MSVNYSISAMPVRLKKDSEGNVVYNENKTDVLYYAKAQSSGKMTFEQFAEHVATHNSKYHKGDILAVVVEVMRCLKEELLNGKQVQLSDLGSFSLILNGPGAPSVTDFNLTTNITAVKVRWNPGKAFSDLRNDPDLQLVQVLTKKEDAKIKKEMREASPSVKDPNGSNCPTCGGSSSNPPAGGGTTPGGSGNTGGGGNTGNTGGDNGDSGDDAPPALD